MILLLLKYWRETALGLALVGLVIGVSFWNTKQQEVGAMRERLGRVIEQRDRLAKATHDTEVLYQRDTVVVKKLIQRYDTITLDRHVTDTVWVAKALDTADSVKRACVRVLADCSVLVAQKDSLLNSYKVQLGLQTKVGKPSKLGLVVKLGAAVGVGYLLGRH